MNKPTNHIQATGYNQVMQDINPKDSKSVHLGVVDDHEKTVDRRLKAGQPPELIEGVRKACRAIRSVYA